MPLFGASAIVLGHVRAVAVLVVAGRRRGRRSRSRATKRVGAEVGRAAEAPAVGVGDAGVEHRDDDARARRGARRRSGCPTRAGALTPRPRRKFHCSCCQPPGVADAARVVRDEAGVRRSSSATRSPRPAGARSAAIAAATRAPVADRQHAPVRGRARRRPSPLAALRRRARDRRRAARVADDDLAGGVVAAGDGARREAAAGPAPGAARRTASTASAPSSEENGMSTSGRAGGDECRRAVGGADVPTTLSARRKLHDKD